MSATRRTAPRRSAAVPEYLVGHHWRLHERAFLSFLGLPADHGLSPEELADRAAMVRNTLMGTAGDMSNFAEYADMVRNPYQPQWPALYARFKREELHTSGPEWACFEPPGRVDLVRLGGDIVTESLDMPNEYALGPVVVTQTEQKLA